MPPRNVCIECNKEQNRIRVQEYRKREAARKITVSNIIESELKDINNIEREINVMPKKHYYRIAN